MNYYREKFERMYALKNHLDYHAFKERCDKREREQGTRYGTGTSLSSDWQVWQEAKNIDIWQPIQFAPKGKVILAYREPATFGIHECLIPVIWSEKKQAWVWPVEPVNCFDLGEFTAAIADDCYVDDSFTHFMPLMDKPSSFMVFDLAKEGEDKTVMQCIGEKS